MTSSLADNFDGLTPEILLESVERALNVRLSGVTIPFPSYINRVYELRQTTGEPLVVKFYRPERWSFAALEEEHEFMRCAAENDVPLISPLQFNSGSTLATTENGIHFAVYPKRSGRRFEAKSLEDWQSLGMLCARLHNAGDMVQRVANRPVLTPERSTKQALDNLLAKDFIPVDVKQRLAGVVSELIDVVQYDVDMVELIAVHGDLHGGNIIVRPNEGLLLIDFDDMAVAPAVQDWWPLLPDYAKNCENEISALQRGYRRFRDIADFDWHLAEGMRAMHMVYYLDWCAKQYGDFMFERTYPDWGSRQFWNDELNQLSRQLDIILERDGDGEVYEW